MPESDDNIVYIEFGNGSAENDPLEPLVNLEASWQILDRIIKRHLTDQGNELSLRRIKRIEDRTQAE